MKMTKVLGILAILAAIAMAVFFLSKSIRPYWWTNLAERMATPSGQLGRVTPSPSPTLPTACDLVEPQQLSQLLGQQFEAPQLSDNSRRDGVLTQRCLYLPTEQKLAPAVLLTLTQPETATAGAVKKLWDEQRGRVVNNARFSDSETSDPHTTQYMDSTGLHTLYDEGKFLLSIQVNMPTPDENRPRQKEVFALIQLPLSQSDSSSPRSAE